MKKKAKSIKVLLDALIPFNILNHILRYMKRLKINQRNISDKVSLVMTSNAYFPMNTSRLGLQNRNKPNQTLGYGSWWSSWYSDIIAPVS